MTTTSMTAAIFADAIRDHGFVRVNQDGMLNALDTLDLPGSYNGFPRLQASFDDLAVDTYMGDGGRYRKRRHGVFGVMPNGLFTRLAHQPHYQSVDHNTLNGGIERWFEPITDDVASSETMRGLLKLCAATFSPLSPDTRLWTVEVHQFRIEAKPGAAGKPTPEGMHRDGVDYVLVMMVRRENIAEGTTTIAGPDGTSLGSFTLIKPLDAVLLDDHRVLHGVTPVMALDPSRPAFRDVLVVTFKAVS